MGQKQTVLKLFLLQLCSTFLKQLVVLTDRSSVLANEIFSLSLMLSFKIIFFVNLICIHSLL